jgi:excisionase family DNA binding protein
MSDVKTGVEVLLLKPRDACKMLNVCERTLRDLKKARKIPYVSIGRAVRYDVADLRAWIASQKIFALAC